MSDGVPLLFSDMLPSARGTPLCMWWYFVAAVGLAYGIPYLLSCSVGRQRIKQRLMTTAVLCEKLSACILVHHEQISEESWITAGKNRKIEALHEVKSFPTGGR